MFKRKKFKIEDRSHRRRRKGGFLRMLIKGITLSVLILVLIGAIAFVIVIAFISTNLPNPENLRQRIVKESSKIYDRTGETILYELVGDTKRTKISLVSLPTYVKKATIIAEDRNFEKHSGFSLKSMLRAIFVNITRQGKIQGGSTITQQLIKNTMLTKEKRYIRKMKELILAYQVEKRFTKEEILEIYFNEIPYGSTIYGIEAASQSYFGKSAKDLDIAEAAVLAGLPQAPTYYSPFGSHKDELLGRQKYILAQMLEEKYINEGEYTEAIAKKIVFRPNLSNIIAPHFVMYIRELLMAKYGEKFLEEEGLKIYTTIDLTKQKIAEETITNMVKINEKQYKASNAALVSLDPKTGEVLAMVGSRDFFSAKYDGHVNVALRPRQPGSSFKPIVYAAAFKKGFTPETVLWDVNTVFKTDNKDYEPRNYDEKEHGPVSMRKALAGSLNIPGVKTLYLAGVNNVLRLADHMGYTTLKDKSRFGLSLVLGGGEVKLLEHTAAFGIFANEGVFTKTRAVLKILDRNNKVLFESQPEAKKVLDVEIARKINSILSDNVARSYIFGLNNKLILPDRPVAAKTGTTNDWRDGWTIGYTPSLVTGVWVGNNNNTPMAQKADGSYTAAPIWNAFMSTVLNGKTVEEFKAPLADTTTNPVLGGEVSATTVIKIDKASGKLATSLTPKNYIIELNVKESHTILKYINPANPNGPPPARPESDPNYKTWEEGIQKFLELRGYVKPDLPTEYDDLHTLENKPRLIVLVPKEDQVINSKIFNVEILASAPRGITSTEYYLDDKLIKKVNANSPFTTLDLSDKNNGFYTLTIKVYDNIDNMTEVNVRFNLLFNP